MLGSEEIKKIIPHREPFLLVDQITELEPGKRATGVKYVREEEDFFQGHFPGTPLMPGVLIVEAMAQVGAVALLAAEDNRGKLALFAGLDGVRFKEPVRPGDTLTMQVELTRARGNIGKGRGEARVGDRLAARGEFMFALAEEKAVG